jgi:hypothetical protein
MMFPVTSVETIALLAALPPFARVLMVVTGLDSSQVGTCPALLVDPTASPTTSTETMQLLVHTGDSPIEWKAPIALARTQANSGPVCGVMQLIENTGIPRP